MAGTTTTTPLPKPREFADEVIKRHAASGTLKPASDGPAKAALLPAFSKGTAALDEETGQPVVPKEQAEVPAFVAGHVDLPAGTDTTGSAPTPGTSAAADATRVAQPAPAAAPADPAQTTGATAAEAVAAQIVEDLEEFEFDDPDLGVKFPVRVPKAYAETAKRGYGRRANYDRAVSFLKNAEPTLRPLIEDGRIQRILPLIQAALQNEHYGTYVTQGFERLSKGLPLIEAARLEAAAAGIAQGVPAAPAQVMDPSIFDPAFIDPSFAEALEARTKPLQTQVEALAAWRNEQLERQRNEEQAQRAQAEHGQRTSAAMQAAHSDLAAMFPGEFNPGLGPNDPAWKKACDYARDAGYLNHYDLRAAIIFGGQQSQQLERERRTATASPAATVLQQTDARLLDAARREAAAAAQTVSGGAASASTMPAPPPKPTPKNADGSLKPKDQYMTEALAWQQIYGRLKG